MTTRRLLTWAMTGTAALAFAAAPAASFIGDNGTSVQADGCYNGTTTLNPYARSCTIPGPANKIRGSAPDANAIIACRHQPGCLSWYVNNP